MNVTGNTLGLVVWLGLACPSLLFAEPVQAARADDLVDSIGVNTHFGYTDRPDWSEYDQVREKLVALGVRHIRDGADSRQEVADRIRRLHSNHGIRVLQGVGPRAQPGPGSGRAEESGSFVLQALAAGCHVSADQPREQTRQPFRLAQPAGAVTDGRIAGG